MNGMHIDTTEDIIGGNSWHFDGLTIAEVEVDVEAHNGTSRAYVQAIRGISTNAIRFRDVRKICATLKVTGYKNKSKESMLGLIAQKKVNSIYTCDDGCPRIVEATDCNSIYMSIEDEDTSDKTSVGSDADAVRVQEVSPMGTLDRAQVSPKYHCSNLDSVNICSMHQQLLEFLARHEDRAQRRDQRAVEQSILRQQHEYLQQWICVSDRILSLAQQMTLVTDVNIRNAVHADLMFLYKKKRELRERL